MKSISITFKIAIWYSLFLVLLAGGMIVLLISAQNTGERIIAERNLVEIIADISEKVERRPEDFIYDKDIKYYTKETYISIYDTDGVLVVGRRPHSVADFPELTNRTFVAILDTQGTEWYVYDRLLEVGDSSFWIRGMMRNTVSGGTGSFLIRFLLIAVPVFILLAVLGGLVITHRLFRPLRDIIATTNDIRADADVSRRIPPTANHDELSELTDSINGMFGTIERSIAREKQFASDVSHELRTPVAVIQAQSEYALEDPTYRDQALGVINAQARHMNTLVNRLLTLSRSDAGTIRPENERIDLSSLLTDIADQQVSEETAVIRTDIQEGVFVWADEVMLVRIVMNLISNAVKYGRTPAADGSPQSDGPAVITIRLREKDGWAECTVADQGRGIPAEEQDKVWDRFYRGDKSRSGGTPGSAGLGLSIVRALTQAMGGNVSLVSREGEGAAFTVRLPSAPSDQ